MSLNNSSSVPSRNETTSQGTRTRRPGTNASSLYHDVWQEPVATQSKSTASLTSTPSVLTTTGTNGVVGTTGRPHHTIVNEMNVNKHMRIKQQKHHIGHKRHDDGEVTIKIRKVYLIYLFVFVIIFNLLSTFINIISASSANTNSNNTILSSPSTLTSTSTSTSSSISTSSSSQQQDVTQQQQQQQQQQAPPEKITLPPGYKHPMNGELKDIQVPANTGPLDNVTVKFYYKQLVKHYLSPFLPEVRPPITRASLLRVWNRRDRSTTPVGAHTGTESLFVQVKGQRVYVKKPYSLNVTSDEKLLRSRVNELIYMLSKLSSEGRLSDTQLVLHVHNCIQTVNHDHSYGAPAPTLLESQPVFTIATCNFSDNIPFPVWSGTHGDGWAGWDAKMAKFSKDTSEKVPWKQKKDMMIFRGKHRQSMYFKEKHDMDKNCNQIGRSKLLFLGNEEPDLLNISLKGPLCDSKHFQWTYKFQKLSQLEFFHNKFVLHAEGICLWSDQLKFLLFGGAVVVKQATPCGQFFEPLLKNDVHFVHSDFFFNDLVDSVIRVKENDKHAQSIVKNANEFARNFLSFDGVQSYVEVLLNQYTKLLDQKEKDITLESDSVDVTFRRVY